MPITILEESRVFRVVGDSATHAVFTYYPNSTISKAIAKARAEGFKQGFLYALNQKE